MDLHLAGKVAVVTGASKGIGLAVTRSLAGEGVNVVAGARDMTGDVSQLADVSPVLPVTVDLTHRTARPGWSRRRSPRTAGWTSWSTTLARCVLLLASDRAGNVTGADFVIDGGMVTTL